MRLLALLVLLGTPIVGTVRVRVLNLAQVPAGSLGEAERITSRILRSAGIEAEWVDCDSPGHPCRDTAGATDLWLQLLARRPDHLEHDTAGFAVLVPDCPAGCGYAAVSYPTIRTVAEEVQADPVNLLGATIAHEIGHLLLGAHAHTREGVMASRFRRNQIQDAGQGTLRFTDQQIRQLQAEVIHRARQ